MLENMDILKHSFNISVYQRILTFFQFQQKHEAAIVLRHRKHQITS